MIQTKITEPTRTPFNPHGFADATPFYMRFTWNY